MTNFICPKCEIILSDSNNHNVDFLLIITKIFYNRYYLCTQCKNFQYCVLNSDMSKSRLYYRNKDTCLNFIEGDYTYCYKYYKMINFS